MSATGDERIACNPARRVDIAPKTSDALYAAGVAQAEKTKESAIPAPLVTLWSNRDWVALGCLTFIAFVLRVLQLDDPQKYIFDETYYAKDSCFYLHGPSAPVCSIPDFPAGDSEITWVHPPLAKWLIAIGVRIFGHDSFGWRIAPLLAGVITIAIFYLLARKLLGSTLPAAFATGLLVIDPLHFVQSRTSMLDIFVPMFGLAAFLFLLFDRDRILDRLAAPEEYEGRNGLLDRPWRIAAGAAGAAAVACKWSGGLILIAVIILSVAWELKARGMDGRGSVVVRFLKEELASIVLWLFVLPIAFYLFTYIGRMDGDVFAAPWSQGSWWRAVWDRQIAMYNFHADLTAHHNYESPAWSWMLIKRPVSYDFCGGQGCVPPIAEGNVKEIFATGSPFVWWSSILAIGYVAFRWVRRTGLARPEGFILAGFAFTYLPWLLIGATSGRGAVFIFYLLPTIPFMCLALAYVLTRLGDSWEAKATLTLFTAGAIGVFAFYYPMLTNGAISQKGWESRIWVFDNCDKPPGPEVTNTITETISGKPTTRETITNDNSSIPPGGWCWI